MIHDIRAAFYDLLEEVTWLDQKTRTVAIEKVPHVLLNTECRIVKANVMIVINFVKFC